jgi:hypothetical protein
LRHELGKKKQDGGRQDHGERYRDDVTSKWRLGAGRGC